MNRPLHLLTRLSTVALLALTILWPASYFRWQVFSDRGQVLVMAVHASEDVDSWLRAKPPSAETWRDLRTKGARRLGGVELDFAAEDDYRYRHFNGTHAESAVWHLRYGLLALPYWLLVLLAAILPLVGLRKAVRARTRRRAGQCARCGYDLRGSPGRCPECGAEPA